MEFERIDVDKSGLIDVGELQKAVEKFRSDIPQAEVKSVIERLDYDMNKQINYSEFIAATIDL
jgi:Ca2+-binding EF-hand superfamily protein